MEEVLLPQYYTLPTDQMIHLILLKVCCDIFTCGIRKSAAIMFWVFSELIHNRMLLFVTLWSNILFSKNGMSDNQQNNLLAITIRTILITLHRKLCVSITYFLIFKDTWYLWAKSSGNMQLLDVLVSNSADKSSFQNPTKHHFAQRSIDGKMSLDLFHLRSVGQTGLFLDFEKMVY